MDLCYGLTNTGPLSCSSLVNWLYYGQNDVNIVPKSANPPNCLELRVIEKYLAIIKQKMKKKKHCRNIKDLKTLLKKASNSYNYIAVCKFMATTEAKVRIFFRCPHEKIN